MEACKCSLTLGNTGLPGCEPIMTNAFKIIYMEQYASDGTRNGVTLADTLNEAYFSGKVNETDPTKRWFPTSKLDNVTDLREDNIIETFEDQSEAMVDQAPRKFQAWFVQRATQLLAKLNLARCKKIAAFIVDTNGSLIGNISADGTTLYPIAIDKNTWRARLVKATATTVQKLQLNFSFAQSESDEDLRIIVKSEMDNYNLKNLDGLLDGILTISDITATVFRVTAKTIYGSAINQGPIPGLLLADITVFNSTTSAAVIPSAVVETVPGVSGIYDVTIAAQTAADAMTTTFTKDGFEFETASWVAV